MESTQLSPDVQIRVEEQMRRFPKVKVICDSLMSSGYKVLLVGGVVRDLVIGLETKDLDIEVYGATLEELGEALGEHGKVSLVGKSFGVLRVHGIDVDWSVPRADSKGRKPEVEFDPFMSYEQAFRRRDLTMNAMGIDLKTNELIDSFGGLKDIKNKVLRTPDPEFFVQDPLRFFRVMHFVGRFEMLPDAELDELCAKMDIAEVSRERIEEEFRKLLLFSKRPSLALDWLNKLGRLKEILPEVFATIGVKQNIDYHKEGDAFEHTKLVLDAAANTECDSQEQKLIFMYAAICHDLGKPATSKFEDGKWRCRGHARAGIEPTKALLGRITKNRDLVDAVCKIVLHHMTPADLVQSGAGPASYKRFAKKLAPDVTLKLIAMFLRADILGCVTDEDVNSADEKFRRKFEQRAEEASVLCEAEPPVLRGRDVEDLVSQGPDMGLLLKAAYDIQIDEGILDKDVLKKRVAELSISKLRNGK